MATNIIKLGPWGGSGGNKWYDGSFNGVRQIKLCWGDYIDSITVTYDNNGADADGKKHGGSGGSNTYTIKLNYPKEYLTGFSGYITSGGIVSSLKFESNDNSYGSYGGAETGTPFSCTMNGGSIVGFLGRSGNFLEAIGFACAPTTLAQKEAAVNESQPET